MDLGIRIAATRCMCRRPAELSREILGRNDETEAVIGHNEAMTSKNPGPWIVAHPEEVVVTFFIQMPDPIDLPDGMILPAFEQLSPATLNLLPPNLDNMFAYQQDALEFKPLRSIVGEDATTDFSQIVLPTCSIQIHQAQSDALLRYQLEPSLRLAHLSASGHFTAEEKKQAMTGLWRGAPADENFISETDAPSFTIAECSISLRLIGTLPDFIKPPIENSAHVMQFLRYNAERSDADAASLHNWVFEDQIDPDLVNSRISEALSICIDHLRKIQKAVHILRRQPINLVTPESMPAAVPLIVRRLGTTGNNANLATVRYIAVRASTETLAAHNPLMNDELEKFGVARQQVSEAPFTIHLDLHREAHVALQRNGNTRLGALMSGISAETLLDELILYLMWEDKFTPEHAATEWREGLTNRVTSELQVRLGGPWDLNRSTPPGFWAQDVVALRNRVAHTGYEPTREEAWRALEAVNALVTFLCDRIANPNVRNKYPRTALTLVGHAGLKKRNALTKRLRNLQENSMEVDWQSTFSMWHATWLRCRQDRNGVERSPDPSRSSLLLVVNNDGRKLWVLHDYFVAMAIEVIVDETQISPEARLSMHLMINQYRESGMRERISFLVEELQYSSFVPGSEWVEQYHLVPLTDVMMDGSDSNVTSK